MKNKTEMRDTQLRTSCSLHHSCLQHEIWLYSLEKERVGKAATSLAKCDDVDLPRQLFGRCLATRIVAMGWSARLFAERWEVDIAL